MSDKMREEFEAAISIETGRPVQEFRDDRQGESYASVGPKYAWWGWKASREAVVIELPGQEKFTNWGRYSDWRLRKIAELEAAGVRVKP